MSIATRQITVTREAGKPSIIEIPGVRDMEEAIARLTIEKEAVVAEMTSSGSVLVRGLPVTDAESFARVRDVLLPQPASYKEKATPRTDFGGGVFSSTDLPAVQPIRLHNENSYTLDFPGALLFCCVVAPDKGGATTVGDMREALALIPEDLRRRFEEHGWLLVRNYSDLAGLPWQTSFATDSPAEVEDYCSENVIGCEWLDEETLRTRQRRSAIITHPLTGERVWFNHAAFWSRWSLDEDVRDVLLETYGEDGLPFETFVGDGTPLTREEAESLNEAYTKVTRRETYQVGDLLLVDNILNAHGREAFEGDRKILVAMGDPVPLANCAPTAVPSTTMSGNGDRK